MDLRAATRWPQPAPGERPRWVELADLAGLDGEWIMQVHEKGVHRTVEAPSRWVPLSDQEWHEIEPFLPASVRGARGAPPRAMLDLLLYRAASRTTGWRDAARARGIDGDSSRQKWSRWAGPARVLDRLLGARSYLKLTPGRREQLDALEVSVMEERRRQQQNDSSAVRP